MPPNIEEMEMDAVAIGALLSVAISAVILIVMIIKGISLINQDPPEDK